MLSRSSLARNTGLMSAGVFLSQILGLVREQVFAFFFGATAVADAFNLGFTIPNLLRRFFGEGALSAAFIPLYNEAGAKKGREEQIALGLNVLSLLTFLLTVLMLLGILLAPLVVRIVAPGWNSELMDLTVKLTRIMFPYLFLIGLSSTMISILNAHDYYFLPGLNSAFFNIGQVGFLLLAVWLFKGNTEEYIILLSVGVVFGGILQTVVNIPLMRRVGYRFKVNMNMKGDALTNLWKRYIPGAISVSIDQVNWMIDRALASFLVVGSISSLTYGFRIMHLPLGIIGVSVGTAAIQHFSKNVALSQYDDLSEKLRFATINVLYLMIPVTAIICGLGRDYLQILFMRGAFDQSALSMTYLALLGYCVGLTFFSMIRVVIPVYHAHGDTKSPFRIALWSVAANTVFNLALMFPLKHAGLALGTSLAAGYKLWMLHRGMKRRFPMVRLEKVSGSLTKIGLLSVAIFCVLFWGRALIPGAGMMAAVLRAGIFSAVGLMMMIGGSVILRIEYSDLFWKALWKKIRRR